MKVWVAIWDSSDPEAYATREALMESIDQEVFLNDPYATVTDTYIYFTDYVTASLVEVQGL